MHTHYIIIIQVGPPQLKWRCGPDMPFAMGGYIQSVQIQGTVYVGGGTTGGGGGDYIVMACYISAGIWAMLPPYSARWFAMTAINNTLVLVGGEGHDGAMSKVLGMWSEDRKKWTHPYPDMTTVRVSCSAVMYKHYLVVAGGRGVDGRLSSIEVMNTDTKLWYAGPPTPIAWSIMNTAIVGDTCYFMGGITGIAYTKEVYSVSLPALISQLNSDKSAKDTQTWKKLPQLPVTQAVPLSISGSLLAVGGWVRYNRTASTAIHLYQPDTGKWVKILDMPAPRQIPACIMTTDSNILVAGGYHRDPLATMDIAHADMLTALF